MRCAIMSVVLLVLAVVGLTQAKKILTICELRLPRMNARADLALQAMQADTATTC